MARELAPVEVREIVARHKITADMIPTYGLRIEDQNRDIMIGLVRAGPREGDIVGFDLTVFDESGKRVTMTDAQLLSLQEDLLKWLAYPVWWFGRWGSEHRIDDKVIALILVLVGLWTASSVKTIFK
jgi:hypothetical protein